LSPEKVEAASTSRRSSTQERQQKTTQKSSKTTKTVTCNAPNIQNNKETYFLIYNRHVASPPQQHMFMSGDSAFYLLTFP